MRAPNLLFAISIITFCIVSYIVYLHHDTYDQNISKILNSTKVQPYVLIGFLILSSCIICYEYSKDCIHSLLCMSMCLIGLFGVISIPEMNHRDHYSFVILLILGTLLFMKQNCISTVLAMSLFIQLILLMHILNHVIERNKRIFLCELALIINFVFFYSYLHYVTFL